MLRMVQTRRTPSRRFNGHDDRVLFRYRQRPDFDGSVPPPSHELTATCGNYAASGGCSRDRSGRVWLSKISSSPSRNGPASPPTGLSIIVSPR